jgi:hypothetical protein
MTALRRYQRLESSGLWRESPLDQRREVLVRLGEATLTLSDPKSGEAISHWSLPAIERINRGETPPVFAPGGDAGESLELSDPDMIAALDTVQAAVRAAAARPGRLRGLMLGGITLAILGLAALWLPDALVTHTASVVPPAQRAELGQRVLDDLVRVTGAPCDSPLGLAALAALSERVFGPVDTPILYVLPEGVEQPLHLPGDVIVLPRRLIEQADGPEAAAGAALVEGLRSRARDPILPLLDHAGLRATFRLLTTADLTDDDVSGYGEAALRGPPLTLPEPVILQAFEAAQIPTTPYATAIAPGDPAAAALAANDPYRGLAPAPLISDESWVALQEICGG